MLIAFDTACLFSQAVDPRLPPASAAIRDPAPPTVSRRAKWLHRTVAACGSALTLLLLGACGGGDGDSTPQVVVSPADRLNIVGQVSSFHVEAQGSGLSFAWEVQAPGSSEWRASTGAATSDGQVSNLIVDRVDIGMDKSRFRARVTNSASSVTSAEARLDVVWGAVSTLEPNSFDFGPGAGGFGGSDGGTPGGGDGDGAGVGGGLGKTLRVPIEIRRTADGASLGSALTGATSGLVRVKAGPGAAPVAITLRGAAEATYYDEGRDAILPLGADQQLHALVLAFDRHLGVTTLTEAAYRYAINQFILDPDAVRDGTVALQRTATPEDIARLTPALIELANGAIRNEINRLLPPRYQLDSASNSIATLPTPVDNNSPPGSITNNIYGRMQAVVGGLALAAATFEPLLANPALTMNAQLADDLTDGVIDGLSLDQRSVFGAPGSNAYGPDSLSRFLTEAADAMFDRFGDGSINWPAITTQPASVSINPGQSATLSVVARGPSLTYQWQLGDTPIPGATAATYVTSTAGSYAVVVTNSAGSVTSNAATVTVVVLPIAASVQPASVAISQGQTVTLTASVTGTAPFTYQWSNANGPIPGATAATYTTGMGGVYTVTVRNAAGSSTASATVTVVIPPEITQQPTWTCTTTCYFEVIATGTPSLLYQWYQVIGGAEEFYEPVSGATASTFIPRNTGTYVVEIRNEFGSVRSDEATFLPPLITQQPTWTCTNQPPACYFEVIATGPPPLTYRWYYTLTDEPPYQLIAGATAARFDPQGTGYFFVGICNQFGCATSDHVYYRHIE